MVCSFVWVGNGIAIWSLENKVVVITFLRLILDSHEFTLNTMKSHLFFCWMYYELLANHLLA
jgi:hypothetical protein